MGRTFDAKQKTAGVSQSYPFFVAATTEFTRDHRAQSCLAPDSLFSRLLSSRSTELTLSSLVAEQQEHRGTAGARC